MIEGICVKNSTTARFVALGLSAALVLAGCSSNEAPKKDPGNQSLPSAGAPTSEAPTASKEDVATMKAIEMTGKSGETPTLKFKTPFSVTAPVLEITEPGTGDTIKAGDTVSLHSIAFAGTDGKEIPESNTFKGEPQPLALDPAEVFPLLVDALVGQQVGTRLVFSNPLAIQKPEDAFVMAIEVMGTKSTPKPLERAQGAAVEPPAGLPTVALDDTGKPTITIPKDYKAPAKLVSEVLIKGEGEKVSKSQKITAHYTGLKLNGEQFDSSWDAGKPLSIPLSNVVQGWTQGLDGQTVGSQVLLVIPPELGYGSDKSNPLADETLVFVVDILGVA